MLLAENMLANELIIPTAPKNCKQQQQNLKNIPDVQECMNISILELSYHKLLTYTDTDIRKTGTKDIK